MPPSGKIHIVGYLPVNSITYCLSLIYSTIYSLYSAEAPLEINRHPIDYTSIPNTGTFFKDLFDANAGLKCDIRIAISNHDV